MKEFRSCPAYPGYDAARDGTIRRAPWIKTTKTGRAIEQAASVITHVGRDRAYVTQSGKFIRWDAMVADVWPDEDRGLPLYPGARVITVAEWIAEKRSALLT